VKRDHRSALAIYLTALARLGRPRARAWRCDGGPAPGRGASPAGRSPPAGDPDPRRHSVAAFGAERG